jgi:hypothetical protein
MAKVSGPPKKVTRDDIERELRKLQDDVSGRVDQKKNTLVTSAVAGGVIVLLIFFFLGKRAGKKKSTLVEIRRL